LTKEPATSGGRPHKDKRHRAKERAKRGLCIILHNLSCYQFRYVEQMIECEQKFRHSWRYRTAYKLSCLSTIRVSNNYSMTYPTDEYGSIPFMLVIVIAMRFPNIMLRIARISRRRCHSFDEKEKGISQMRVAEAEAATFEVRERKATTGVGESESKRGFLTLLSLSHSKPCIRLSSRTTAPKLSDKRKKNSFSFPFIYYLPHV